MPTLPKINVPSIPADVKAAFAGQTMAMPDVAPVREAVKSLLDVSGASALERFRSTLDKFDCGPEQLAIQLAGIIQTAPSAIRLRAIERAMIAHGVSLADPESQAARGATINITIDAPGRSLAELYAPPRHVAAADSPLEIEASPIPNP